MLDFYQAKKEILNKTELDEVDLAFDESALRVLAARYLLRNEKGMIIEGPKQMFERIAILVACSDILHDTKVYDINGAQEKHGRLGEATWRNAPVGKYILNPFHLDAFSRLYNELNEQGCMKLEPFVITEWFYNGKFDDYEILIQRYYDLMVSKDFLPNTPTLMNAGAPLGQLSACFVLDIQDDMASIMDTAKDVAMIFKSGGGVGINYSTLRPEGDNVKSTSGVASGPISFMKVIDAVTGVVKQGGKRRGANMGLLNCIASDTQISTTKGKRRIQDLVGQQPLLYCLNENNELRIRQAVSVVHNGVRKLVRIEFDNGDHLDSTPDHRVMLSNGLYKEAGNLQKNDSIMAFYEHEMNGYKLASNTNSAKWITEHSLVVENYTGILVKQKERKRKPDDLCIHHIDHDRKNNDYSNLQLMTISQHMKIHYKEGLEDHRIRIAQERKGKKLEDIYDMEIVSTWKQKMSDKKVGRKPWNAGLKGEEYIAHYQEGIKNQFSNHKVVSVTELNGAQDVYDIIMADYHNFVANGVFVHNCDHPDIRKFISCKTTPGELENFNISVVTDENFWNAVVEDRIYTLKNPRNGDVPGGLNAKYVLDLIAECAWKSAEPGLLFVDNANKHNPCIQSKGKLTVCNPCGEQFLYPYESCNLGSINLSNFVKDGEFEYERFDKTVKLCTRFLDNIIDVNKYPLERINVETKKTRRIGLGIMGLADALFKLDIAYNSGAGYTMMDKIAERLSFGSMQESSKLAKERGSYPLYNKDDFINHFPVAGAEGDEYWRYLKGLIAEHGIRNAWTTTIAPTGTLSMIAGCSSGIEPAFGLAFEKHVTVGKFTYLNEIFMERMREFFKDEKMLASLITANHGSCKNILVIPDAIQRVFVTAMDIHWADHIYAEAVWQRWISNAIAKTINMPGAATVADVKRAYLIAHELGLKGITVYRDGSRAAQVLHVAGDKAHTTAQPSDAVKKALSRLSVNEYIDEEIAHVVAPVMMTADLGPLVRTSTVGSIDKWTTPTIATVTSTNRGSMAGGAIGVLEPDKCPSCLWGSVLRMDGCMSCKSCGWSACSSS